MRWLGNSVEKSGEGLRLPQWRLTKLAFTIRGRIAIAFLLFSFLIASLGVYATMGIRNAGLLVHKTFDQSLMSINYARSAAADFANMQAAFTRQWIETDQRKRDEIEATIQELSKTLSDDLEIAVQRSQSPRAANAAHNVSKAVEQWKLARTRLLSGTQLGDSWETLDRYAARVVEQTDLLVNYTSGDGFLFRQAAQESVSRDIRLNIVATVLALLLAIAITHILTRRIVGPVSAASSIAGSIASGKLDTEIPVARDDELGALLDAMRIMRDNIKSMMDHEVSQRRSAQARLVDALESSREGVVLVDADSKIVLANSEAANFLKVSRHLLMPGVSLAEISHYVDAPILLSRLLTAPKREQETTEIKLTDGRYVRISRSGVRDGGFILMCSDITMLKTQKASLSAAKSLLNAALDNMSQGLCFFDEADRLQVVNSRFYDIFHVSREVIKPGMTFLEMLRASVAVGNHGKRTAEDLYREQKEFFVLHPDDNHHYEFADGRIVSVVYRSTAGHGWVATYEDVTERHHAEAKILHMARHDALTDLPNRLLFREKTLQSFSQHRALAVLFVDLDRFKSVNDTLGHPIGDALLCAVTERLKLAIRGADIISRLGGDEFAVVQLGANPETAATLAERIINTLSEPFEIRGHQVLIGASIGIALAPADGRDPDQLLKNADMALYRAKAEGRGTFQFFQQEMDVRMQERRYLELDLRKAVAASQFVLHYQPIVDIEKRKITGFEALLRWMHPEKGLIMPDSFIPIAEEIGLISNIGEWVIRQACQDASKWPNDIGVAVNLSAVQFRSPTLVLSVISNLAASDLSPHRLGLEITETVFLQDDRLVLDTLHQLREVGVRISLDDFGTGYSSLSYLRSFPFDKIKIDRSFTQELQSKEDAVAIVQTIVQLGTSLGMKVIAEGVETREQFEILKKEGCTEVQGFLFSRPKPIGEISFEAKFRDKVAA
ncbi:MAG TPA: EAL domain-containing protein [Xanthobacteraceae bacterium]|jgi:diguanylate cyclase (GGDEF)-like protein|nr:EAL domain-containing protein [Xanthobacteraceae bacterium]